MSFKIKPVGNKARISGSQLASHIQDSPFQKIAKETLNIIETGKYSIDNNISVDVSGCIKYATTHSKYYLNEPSININKVSPLIEVTSETTTQAAERLIKEGHKDIVALNFASPTNPGGGWIHGARAQEEDLCRRSSLYDCLLKKGSYYSNNILNGDGEATDGIIYSPQVPFFRAEDYSLLDIPYSLSIITSPAPNVWCMKDPSESNIRKILNNRTKKILRVAADNNHKTIILGAWGCGVFGNNAQMVSEAFDEALKEVPAFKHVCFAIYDSYEGKPTFNTFNDHFVGLE